MQLNMSDSDKTCKYFALGKHAHLINDFEISKLEALTV